MVHAVTGGSQELEATFRRILMPTCAGVLPTRHQHLKPGTVQFSGHQILLSQDPICA